MHRPSSLCHFCSVLPRMAPSLLRGGISNGPVKPLSQSKLAGFLSFIHRLLTKLFLFFRERITSISFLLQFRLLCAPLALKIALIVRMKTNTQFQAPTVCDYMRSTRDHDESYRADLHVCRRLMFFISYPLL